MDFIHDLRKMSQFNQPNDELFQASSTDPSKRAAQSMQLTAWAAAPAKPLASVACVATRRPAVSTKWLALPRYQNHMI